MTATLKQWGARWAAFKKRASTSTPPIEDQVDRLLDEHLATTFDPMVDLPPEEYRAWESFTSPALADKFLAAGPELVDPEEDPDLYGSPPGGAGSIKPDGEA